MSIQRHRPRAVTVAIAIILSCAWAQDVAAQHAVSVLATCDGPVAVGDTLHCLSQICHQDSFGDSLLVTQGYAIVDPDGLGIRVPPVGSLPIALLEGNAATSGGGWPAVIGDANSTLGGLPGIALPGYITIELEFLVVPGLPDILPVRFFWEVTDQCDSPHTSDCFPFPNQVLFQALAIIYCKGDADGNGVVGVDDLNAVILDWGTDGSAHGGDLSGALPGTPPDGEVDINDLITVIVSWGTCP